MISKPSTPRTLNLGVDPRSIGPWVTFKKSDYGSEVDVIIPGVLEITRGNNGGIFNKAVENSYQNNQSPTNTVWNTKYVGNPTDSWFNASDAAGRNYDNWQQAMDGYPPGAFFYGLECIMLETTTNRYFLVKFLSWTAGGNGGGFSYERAEILSTVSFVRPSNSPSTVDIITPGKTILKRDNIRGLYNAAIESKYNQDTDLSPLGTMWNSVYTDNSLNGFSDVTNVRSRVYSSLREACNNQIGNNIVGLELIMLDEATNQYYKVLFSDWGIGDNGNLGNFAYERTLIPLNEAVVYADGSIMDSASSSGGTVDGNGNVIVADSSNNTVSVGPGGTQQIDNFSGMLIVNDHFDGAVELWIAGGGDTVPVAGTNTGGGPVVSTLTISGSGYEWTNAGNLNGPFTFTVIKTRSVA